jgi:hypothetical protein
MIKILALLFVLFTVSNASAVDVSSSVTETRKFEHWQVTEFAGARQLMYRASSQSIDRKPWYLAFDVTPLNGCVPLPAVLIVKYDSYVPVFNKGLLIYSYKSPNQKEATELTKSEMSPGDRFAFFTFKALTIGWLLRSEDRGKLAMWIPASGDGKVKQSDNVYFSLQGLSLASKEATRLCIENM